MKETVRRFIQTAGIALFLVLCSSFLFPWFQDIAWPYAADHRQHLVVNAESVEAAPSATALMQQGQKHYEQEQFLAAGQALMQAAKRYQQLGNVSLQAQALSLQALALNQLGQRDAAQRAIAQSFSLLSQPHLPVPDEKRIRAQVFNSQGHIQLALGQGEAALASWTSAETSYREAGATAAVLGIQINQAQALQSLGFFRRAENLLNALERELRADELTPSAGALAGALKVKGLLTLGNVLRLGGEVERAKAVLTEGLAIAQSMPASTAVTVTGAAPEQGTNTDVGKALLSLGNTERVLAKRSQAMQDPAASEQHVQAALQRYQAAIDVAADDMTRAQSQLNQLSLLIESGRRDEALALQSQITEAIAPLSPSRAAIYARVNLARCAIMLTPEQAPDIAQQLAVAVDQSQSLEDRRAESYALGTLGLLYETSTDFASATATTERALAIARAIDAEDIVYQWQWQLGRLFKSSDLPVATMYYTSAVETLNTLRGDLVMLNPDIQFSFRESVEPVYRELVDLLLQAKEPTIQQLTQVQSVLEALQLAELDNFFRDACARPKVVNIDEIDKSAAVIYPVVLPNRLAVILKLPGENNLYYASDRTIGEAQVDEVVKQFLRKLKRRSTLPSELQIEARQLYQWLIEPFATDLDRQFKRADSKIKTIVFVLDGSLRNVPMATLYDGEQYLVERYAIGLTPGLQLLSPEGLRQGNLKVLLAGTVAAPSFIKEGVGSLDNVAFELAGVEALVSRSTLLEDEDFKQAALRDRIEKTAYDVVHLATHGNFSSNPDQTYLLDWDSRISANDIDTLFQVGDPSRQNAVELLVLSACETAAGDKKAALGLAGIAIRADVRSTLATLWQVNDASTAEFMVRFYEQLSAGDLTKSEAVRAVQISFLRDYATTDYDRPFHWAPFTLVGNWL